MIPAETPEPSPGGVPEAIPAEQTGEVTNKIVNPAQGARYAEGEFVGEFKVLGQRELKGDTLERTIQGISHPPTTDIRPFRRFIDELIADAKASGAKQLVIKGEYIGNKFVHGLKGTVRELNGTIRKIDDVTNEIIISIP